MSWLRSRRCPFHQFIQRDKAQAVILDVDALTALATGLVWGFHIDGLHQFPKGIGVKGFDAHILLRRLDEFLNVFALSFLYFNVLPQGDDLSLILSLLIRDRPAGV